MFEENKQLRDTVMSLHARLDRIETEKDRISNLTTEKKSPLKTNPDSSYPPEHLPAPEDLYSKAVTFMSKAIVTIERSVRFDQEPGNFILEVCRESNKAANNFRLTKSQQQSLIMSFIPASSTEFFVLRLCKSLQEVYGMVTMYSSKISTRPELERKLFVWKLDNTSSETIMKTVLELIEIITKLNEDEIEENKVEQHVLYKKIISRIQQEKFPNFVVSGLDEAYVRIHRDHTILELTQLILNPLQRFAGMRQAQSKNQVHQISSDSQVIPGNSSSVPMQFTVPPPPITQVKQVQNAGTGNAQKNQKPKQEGKNKNRNQNDGKKDNYVRKEKRFERSDKYDRRMPKRQNFVEPWPVGKNYLSKNGNTLTGEFENHFRGFCFKCGHSSHQSDQCRIYPDKTIILDICSRCRQGLHETCKSRRYDLTSGVKKDGQDSLMSSSEMVKALEMITKKLESPNHVPYPVPIPMWPGHGNSGSFRQLEDGSGN